MNGHQTSCGSLRAQCFLRFACNDTPACIERGLSDGCGTYRYEKIGVYHSWNANWLFTNSIVFSVQRHSDHHAHAYKPYQASPSMFARPLV